MLNFKVDENLCIQCGQCVSDCPRRCIIMKKESLPYISKEENCMRCQHCLAICPTGAISIMGIDPDQSLKIKNSLPSPQSMEVLIKGRRSTRHYKQHSLEADTIRRLLEISWHSPTGTNTEGVLLTATMNLAATEALRQEVYSRLDEMLADVKSREGSFKQQYISRAHGAYRKHGVDVVFRGAPHILIASAPKQVPTPKQDCLIALSTFDLLAQTMGVGTVWNGMFKWCVADFFPDLGAKLGVPNDHVIGYALAFGPPAVQFQRTVQRGPARVNLVENF